MVKKKGSLLFIYFFLEQHKFKLQLISAETEDTADSLKGRLKRHNIWVFKYLTQVSTLSTDCGLQYYNPNNKVFIKISLENWKYSTFTTKFGISCVRIVCLLCFFELPPLSSPQSVSCHLSIILTRPLTAISVSLQVLVISSFPPSVEIPGHCHSSPGDHCMEFSYCYGFLLYPSAPWVFVILLPQQRFCLV